MTTPHIPTHLVIMAKAPVAGEVKTRLIPALGAQGAADMAKRMLVRTVNTALAARGEHIHTVTVCAAPDPQHEAWSYMTWPADVQWTTQGEGDLGQRMARSVRSLLSKKERLLLVGTDLPGLTVALLQDAAHALDTHDVSLLPTSDGGYGLLGLRSFVPEIFNDMPWSTSQVLPLTLQRLAKHAVHVGPVLHDIDEPADLVHWPEPLGVHHAGRSCPLSYRYSPQALARAPVRQAQTLYVVGGLYGNVPALDALDALTAQETGPVTVCFNGDFNWFNVDARFLREVNTRVLRHDAIAGNVEAELCTALDEAGCGCAYPESVDPGVVERSNRIHARLKTTMQQHPDIRMQLSSLPMYARYEVCGLRVAVVHGDAESLAGWSFDHGALSGDNHDAWLAEMFAQAQVDVFASSHTCVPVLKDLGGVVINNGAAGMPNFSGCQQGLITRISAQPSPHALYGVVKKGVHIQALPLAYEAQRWEQDFLKQWPAGSDAHVSYFARIQGRLSFEPEQALV